MSSSGMHEGVRSEIVVGIMVMGVIAFTVMMGWKLGAIEAIVCVAHARFRARMRLTRAAHSPQASPDLPGRL